MKACTRCKNLKAVSCFNRATKRSDGLQGTCKDCQKECYEICRESVSDQRRSHREAHPEKVLLGAARKRASVSNIPFDIEESDIEIPNTCPILNIPLIMNKGSLGPNSVSLDRIVTDLGYIKGNVQVISYKANTMKSNATSEELLMFSEWIQRTFG